MKRLLTSIAQDAAGTEVLGYSRLRQLDALERQPVRVMRMNTARHKLLEKISFARKTGCMEIPKLSSVLPVLLSSDGIGFRKIDAGRLYCVDNLKVFFKAYQKSDIKTHDKR